MRRALLTKVHVPLANRTECPYFETMIEGARADLILVR